MHVSRCIGARYLLAQIGSDNILSSVETITVRLKSRRNNESMRIGIHWCWNLQISRFWRRLILIIIKISFNWLKSTLLLDSNLTLGERKEKSLWRKKRNPELLKNEKKKKRKDEVCCLLMCPKDFYQKNFNRNPGCSRFSFRPLESYSEFPSYEEPLSVLHH